MNNKTLVIISIIIIIAAGLFAYSNSLSGEFVWDDDYLIADNKYIKNWCYLKDIFSGKVSTDYVVRNFRFYRPLQMFTYTLDYHIWGLNSEGYHITNLLLHIAAALCIYWLISLITGSKGVAFLTGLFFVIHPVNTEAVSYISGRSDLLAAFFILLCMVFYAKNMIKVKVLYEILIISAYILALLSRETSLILIALLLLLNFVTNKEIKKRTIFSVLAISAVYITVRLTFLKWIPGNITFDTSVLERLPGFFAAIFEYIRVLVIPVDLHMEYGEKIFALTDVRVIAGFVISTFLMIIAIKKRNNKVIVFSMMWFFINLLPVSNIYPLNAYMAEHWLYLPAVGFFLILANAFVWLYKRSELFKWIAVFLVFILIGIYLILTIKQNHYWRDPVTFFERAVEYSPRSFRVYNNLGRAYIKENRTADAVETFTKALSIKPDYVMAYYNLGVLYKKTGDYDKSIQAYKKTIELYPTYVKAYCNLGNVYVRKGKFRKVLKLYNDALSKGLYYHEIYYNLGNTYEELGNTDKAIKAYRKAIEINPRFGRAYSNIAIIYTKKGENEKAIDLFKKAIDLDPGYVAAYYNLAVIYFKNKEYEISQKYYKKALELGHKGHPLISKRFSNK